MKKVLIVITTEFLYFGGLTNVMMNYYKALNKDGLQIDFASTNEIDETDSAYKFIKNNGSNYFCLGNRKKDTINYLRRFYLLLKKNGYDVVHVNGNSATMALELFITYKLGIKIRISHGHTTRSNHPVVHFLLKKALYSFSTHRIAVSDETGRWLYGKNYIVLNNAIDLNKYAYNEKIRKKIRTEIGVDEFRVVGTVGKLYGPKNHDFLLDIFRCIVSKNDNYRLVLAGGGELENKLKRKAEEIGILDKVIFLGMRDDIADVVQGFDVFVFPSIYEGLGLAVIEAQASGLKCFASDAVPVETKVTDNIRYLSLNETATFWADAILSVDTGNREELSVNAMNTIKKCGYDINVEVAKLEGIYRI